MVAHRLVLADLQGQAHLQVRVDLRVQAQRPQVEVQPRAVLREPVVLQARVVRDGVRLPEPVVVDPLCARRQWRRLAACKFC